MPRYVLSSEAQQDLEDIGAYYRQEVDARVARRVLRGITSAFELVAANPGAGHFRAHLTSEPVKFWPVFSYLVVYDPVTQPLGIARVLHGRRDIAALLRQ